MNRRKFLLSASMSVIALKLLSSTPVLAEPTIDYAPIPYDELMRIEHAFRVLEDYKFDLPAQGSIFRINPWYTDVRGELREVAHVLAIDFRSEDIWKRIEYVETIRRKLDAMLGEDVGAHMRYLAIAPRSWGLEFSFRELLETGELSNLRFTAMNVTGEPA